MVERTPRSNARRSVFVGQVSVVSAHLFHRDPVDDAYCQSIETEGNEGVANMKRGSTIQAMRRQAKLSRRRQTVGHDMFSDSIGVGSAIDDKSWVRRLAFKQGDLPAGIRDILPRA